MLPANIQEIVNSFMVILAKTELKKRLFRGEGRIFDLVGPDFSESCGYMQYLSGDGVCIYH